MNRPPPDEASAPASPVPRGGWLIIALVLAAFALLCVYSNVQKARRDKIETVTLTPAPSPSASVAPAAH